MSTRFLITGMPRSRTAWLAALMNALGTETIHEYPLFCDSLIQLQTWLYKGTEQRPHGYVDGFALIKRPDLVLQHFIDQPIAVIVRDPNDVRASWEKWIGKPISEEEFELAVTQFQDFLFANSDAPNLQVYQYDDLNKYDVVNSLVRHVAGKELPLITWQLFHHLNIQLHKEKSRAYLDKYPPKDQP